MVLGFAGIPWVFRGYSVAISWAISWAISGDISGGISAQGGFEIRVGMRRRFIFWCACGARHSTRLHQAIVRDEAVMLPVCTGASSGMGALLGGRKRDGCAMVVGVWVMLNHGWVPLERGV